MLKQEPHIRKYEYIDALRGIAVTGVVLVHASRQVMPPDALLRRLMNDGALGVQLFFIVSALTLCLSWAARSQHEISPLRNFMIRRFFRVAPMFYVAIPLYLILYGFGPAYWSPNGIQWWFVALTALFLHGFHPETINSVVPGGWSIAVEMMFYAILAVLLPRVKSARSCVLFLVVSLILFLVGKTFVPHLFSYPEAQQYLVRAFIQFNFLSQLPVFAVGMLTYFTFRRGYTGKQVAYAGGMFFALFACLFWIPQVPHHFAAAGLFAVSTLLLAYWPLRLLVNRITIGLGKRSYSILLLHFLVQAGFVGSGASAVFAGSNTGSVLYFLSLLLVTALISSLSYRHIEKRGIAWGARLIKRLENDPQESVKSQGARVL